MHAQARPTHHAASADFDDSPQAWDAGAQGGQRIDSAMGDGSPGAASKQPNAEMLQVLSGRQVSAGAAGGTTTESSMISWKMRVT